MLWYSPGDNKIKRLSETAKLIPFKNTSKGKYHIENFRISLILCGDRTAEMN